MRAREVNEKIYGGISLLWVIVLQGHLYPSRAPLDLRDEKDSTRLHTMKAKGQQSGNHNGVGFGSTPRFWQLINSPNFCLTLGGGGDPKHKGNGNFTARKLQLGQIENLN